MGKTQWDNITRERRFLHPPKHGRYYDLILIVRKKNLKDFQTKNLDEYHDLHVQDDTLLLADAFHSFWNMCLKLDDLDPAHFLSAQELTKQPALKKIKVK